MPVSEGWLRNRAPVQRPLPHEGGISDLEMLCDSKSSWCLLFILQVCHIGSESPCIYDKYFKEFSIKNVSHPNLKTLGPIMANNLKKRTPCLLETIKPKHKGEKRR
ncbi:hypothetical protein NPIL_579071 [Nephila pilipes]|uniref:Uncharacterized protein n=1 Tax=Nephila pilipes TaxID=299642 RepID=A0A8X6NCC2_NEPPI|nr:hypothetical protein NPIL_579071 [Nephila pilipes]